MSQLDYTTDDVPAEISIYESEPVQLGVGKAGKVGVLSVELDGESGRTVLKNVFAHVPLFAQRALYLEESLPRMAYLFLISPSEGILQGDRYRIELSLKNDACAHITTQSATKIYSMNRNYATQLVNIEVDANCYLEFVPDQIIPYQNSRFYQRVNMKVHDNATVIYSEIITPGRVARGERFQYDVCYLKNVARNQNGVLRFSDIAVLQPKRQNLEEVGLLDHFNVVGSVYVLTCRAHIRELNEKLNLCLEKFPNVSGAATIMPRESGVMIRILGDTADHIRSAIYEAVAITRRLVLDAPFSGLRKY